MGKTRGMKQKKPPFQPDDKGQQANNGSERAALGDRMSMTMDTEASREAAGETERAPSLAPSLQGHLGRQLRAVYGELVNEPVPEKFTKLLEELAKKQDKHKQE